jgi:hypothetical protein
MATASLIGQVRGLRERLESPGDGGWCPHLPWRTVFEPAEDWACTAQPEQHCPCGRPQAQTVMRYVADWDGAGPATLIEQPTGAVKVYFGVDGRRV